MSGRVSRRRLLAAGVAAAAGAAAGGIGGTMSRRRAPSDVYLIVTDAMRSDKIGKRSADGREATPHLNALAARAAFFPNAFAAASHTKPAMASIFTGRYPSYHGVTREFQTLPGGVVTLPAFLGACGYFTLGIQSNPWLEAENDGVSGRGGRAGRGFGAGFDVYRYEPIDWGKTHDNGFGLAYARAGRMVASFARTIKGPLAAGERPRFAYLHFMDTHQPWLDESPGECTGRFHPAEMTRGRSPEQILAADKRVIARLLFEIKGAYAPADEELAVANAVNDEAAAQFDLQVPRIMEIIESVSREALVVIVSDHGDEIYEHGFLGHGVNIFNPSLRVPLMFLHPRIRPARVETPVGNAAILPTIAEILGVGLDNPVVSSLLPLAYGAKAAEPVYCEYQNARKVILPDGVTVLEEGDARAGYDLRTDAAENRPLPADSAAERHLKRIRDAERNFAAADGVRPAMSSHSWQIHFAPAELKAAAGGEPLDEGRTEQLRALGYLH